MSNPQLLDIKTANPEGLATGSGTYELTVDGGHEVPTAAIIWTTASIGGEGADQALLSIGFWDGTRSCCTYYRSENGADPTSNAKATRDDCVGAVMSPDGSDLGLLTVTGTVLESDGTSGLEIDLDDSSSGDLSVGAIFFFGSSVVAYSDIETASGIGGITDVTSPGFRPKVVFALTNETFANINTETANAFLSMGIAVDSGTASAPDQGGVAIGALDGEAQTETRASSSDTDALEAFSPIVSGSGESYLGEIRVRDFDSNGFSLQKLATSDPYAVCYLAIDFDDSIGYHMETRSVPSLTVPDTETVTSPGFEAGFLFGISASNQVNTIAKGMAFALGFSNTSNALGDPVGLTVRDQDNTPTTVARSYWSQGSWMSIYDHRGGPATEFDWGARDDDGYVIDWQNITVTAGREYHVLAIENVPALVEPGGVASAEAFGSPVLAPGTLTIEPGGVASAEAFGTPALVSISTIAFGAIGSQEQFGTPVLAAGALTIEPGSVASAEAFGDPTVAAGLLMVFPDGIASAEAFDDPVLVAGALTIEPGSIASAEALGDPVLAAGLASIQLDSIASAEALGSPVLVIGALAVQVPAISSGETFGTPLISSAQTISLDGVASAEAFGDPEMLQGVLVVQPSSIASGEALGDPVMVPGAVLVAPGSIASEEALGEPELLQFVVVRPPSIASGEALGVPVLVSGASIVSPSGVVSSEEFGLPSLLGGDSTILVLGIASGEASGMPFLSGGLIPVTLKKKIHDALISFAKSGTFVIATYDGDTCILEQGTQVSPESVLANEVESAYSRERRHGRKLRDDRASWRWELRLRFHQEVITELFEEEFLKNPITIPRDTSDPESRQAIVSLLNTRYEHPPQQGASNGTEVVFDVNAQLSTV